MARAVHRLKTAAATPVRRIIGERVVVRRLPSELGGAKLYVSPASDIRTLADLRHSSGNLFQVARTYVRRDDVVWDFGANVGIFSVAAAHCAGPSGAVFSVEADYDHAALFHRSVGRLSPNYAPVTVLCAAVADENACLRLNVVARGHSKNYLERVGGHPEAGSVIGQKSVVAVTADWLLKFWDPPQFLKVDTEGAELLVLGGASELLRQHQPIIYLETQHETAAPASALLRQFGYRFFALDEDGNEKEVLECVADTICKPPSRLGNR
jgi:FkbM family methyltransferase